MIRRERHRMLLMAAVQLAFLAALALFLLWMQSQLSAVTQEREMTQKLAQLREGLVSAQADTEDDAALFDAQYTARAAAAAYAIRHGVVEVTDSALWEFRKTLDVTNVLVLDRSGHCLASAFASPADFTGARFNQLREVFAADRTAQADAAAGSEALPEERTVTSLPFGVRYNEHTAYRYYAARINADRVAVVEQNPMILDQLVADVNVWSRLLNNVSVGSGGTCFVVTKRDGVFRYHPDESYIGRDAFAAGVDLSALADGACLWLNVYGVPLYCGVVESEDCYVLCAITEDEFHAFNTTTVTVILFCFFVISTAVIAYSLLLQTAQSRRRMHGEADDRRCVTVLGLAYDLDKLRRLVAGSLVGLVFLFGAAYYMQTLFSLSSASMNNAYRLDEVADTMARYELNMQEVTDQYSESSRVKSRIAAAILQARPDLVTDADLHLLNEALDTQYIAVFDANATITATDSGYKGFRLSDDPDNQSYAFWRLLQGVDSYVQEPRVDDVGIYRQYAGYTLRDAANVPIGFVQLATDTVMLQKALASLDLVAVLEDIHSGRDGFAFAVSKADGTFLYYPESRFIGRDAVSAGLPESLLCDAGSGYATLDGVDYFLSTMETADNYIYIAVPRSELADARLPLALATVGFSLACLLVVCLLSFELDSPCLQHADPLPAEAGAAPAANAGPTAAPARRHRSVSSWARQMWRDARHPEKSVLRLLGALLSLLAACVAVSELFAERFYASNSVLHYVMSGNWQHGVNIFAITGCLLLLCTLYTAALLCGLVLRMLTVVTDARGRTVCLLLSNVIKYALVLVGLYYCLSLLGVDTATLVASAGIFSLVIGLGAQSLINDILAGLFIIFEGEFQVGDIVTIGDWRGTVVSVGLRTTRVENSYGDIKSISNHTVTSSINMTQKPSTAQVDMFIPAAYPLSEVEPLLTEKLPEIARRLPAIQDGPRYRGVVSVNAAGTTVRFTAKCVERDRSQLTRDMARAIRLLLEQELGIAAAPAAKPAEKQVQKPAEKQEQKPAEKPEAGAAEKTADKAEETAPAAAAAK